MNIGFDGQFFLKGEKTGIAWSADRVIKHMKGISDIHKQIFCFGLGYNSRKKTQVYNYEEYGCSIRMCNWFHDVIYRTVWNFIPIPYSLFFGKSADVTVFFNFIVPPGVNGKTIAVVHDMAYRTYPETVRGKTKKILERAMEKSCQRADKIITISEFSKKEILKYFSIPESKIEVVPWGVETKVYHDRYSADNIENVKNHYAISGDYILYLGTIEPRKNIERLIRAYSLLNEKDPGVPILVLAGQKGWYYDEIFGAIEELHLEEKVKFLGYVPEADVPVLLCGAKMFVFPSLYEGFGLPPLEAMACGTPVVTSDAASLPEIAKDAAVLVDPFSIESIANGMDMLITNNDLREKVVKAGLERAKMYRWEKSAERIEHVCRELVKEV